MSCHKLYTYSGFTLCNKTSSWSKKSVVFIDTLLYTFSSHFHHETNYFLISVFIHQGIYVYFTQYLFSHFVAVKYSVITIYNSRTTKISVVFFPPAFSRPRHYEKYYNNILHAPFSFSVLMSLIEDYIPVVEIKIRNNQQHHLIISTTKFSKMPASDACRSYVY